MRLSPGSQRPAASEDEDHLAPGRAQALLWLTAVLIVVGPVRVAAPGVGLDPGWVAALNLTRPGGMHYGRELSFTFGPWGFLDVPLVVTRLDFVLGLLFSLASAAALWLLILTTLRFRLTPLMTLLATSLLTLIIASVSLPSLLLAAVGLVVCVRHLRQIPTVSRSWHLFAVAALAALLVQIKFSEGVVVTALALAAGLASPWARLIRTAGVALAWVMTSLLLWLVAGQSVSDIGPWLRASTELAAGYTGAMSLEVFVEVASFLWYAMAVLLIVFVLVQGWRQRARDRLLSHAGAVLVMAGALLFGFKQSFTRHSLDHNAAFFVMAVLMLCTLLDSAPRRRALALLIGVATVMAGPAFSPYVRANPVEAWGSTWRILTNDASRSAVLDRGRAQDQAAYALPGAMVAAARGHAVSVDPWEVSLAWAYSMRWRPMPVFQSYAAYTAHLDQLNADAAEQAGSAQMIIRATTVSTKSRPSSIDHRNPMWESPRYTLTAVCNYSVVTADKRWMLLRKDGRRCGDPSSTLIDRRVAAGESVAVPRAGANQIVIVSFLQGTASPLASLVALAVRDIQPLSASLDGSTFRLPEGLATGPLLVVLPKLSGWPAAFRGHTSARSVTFSRPGEVVFRTIDLRR